ncbi:MAG: hypothetical protein HQL88_07465 [Magnetococcales bacterium]|nr:hypothetical protein [Magnetococcales bacterium]
MLSTGEAGPAAPPAPAKATTPAPAKIDADFQSEIKLSCEKYAKEDQIPPKEVKEYVAQCIRDFSEAQPTDEFPPFESEEGILGGTPTGGYNPLGKSMEMEKAYPIDPPPAPKPPAAVAPAAPPTGATPPQPGSATVPSAGAPAAAPAKPATGAAASPAAPSPPHPVPPASAPAAAPATGDKKGTAP